MKNLDNFIKFVENKSTMIKLTDAEKTFLWNKMEVKKKAKAQETENDVYQMLKDDKSIDSTDDFIKILNTLEYSMKKRVKSGEAPKGMYEEAFNSLKKKLPSEWVGVKFSSLTAHKKKLEREVKKKEKEDNK